MRRRWTAAIGAITGIMMIASSSSGCSCSRTSPDAGSTATHPLQSGSAAPQVMSSRDDLQSPTPLAWDSWRETAPTTIEVTFLSGPASCTGIHATVVETTNDITIDLMQGALPGSVNCPAIALTSTTTIDLGQPRGDRDVIQSAS